MARTFFFWVCCLAQQNLVTTQVEIDLHWWDSRTEGWQGVSCKNGVGPCISFEISPGGHRILSAYIHRGQRMTVHLHSFGYASDFQVFIKANEVPTAQSYDFKLSRNEPGFAEWTCKGVLLYWRVQLSHGNAKAKFGVTITQDTCLHKDYTQQCPVGWNSNLDGWCKPPKSYMGPCRRQNFFGQRELGHEYSNPASKVYKLLWSERCDATWPCIENIGHQCIPDLNYLELGKWRHSACKEGEVCKVFLLSPAGTTGDWRMLMISVPAGSTVGVEIMPILTSGYVSRFRHQNLDASTGNTASKELVTLAVKVSSESTDAGELFKW
eukprot:CAMPEP_0197583694 /NCGR_PEP_ID=MMETSP1326-20131121/6530_1 /TAXON_ID=1155430 /ORGANISM="Genus nov. species nov., Strain RCC2288" /LENGTH=323 /DNA_ID=CAMNT_0043147949 /DNA_START=264 /DNA_END=1232 /DNA_ORIENTATION=+